MEGSTNRKEIELCVDELARLSVQHSVIVRAYDMSKDFGDKAKWRKRLMDTQDMMAAYADYLDTMRINAVTQDVPRETRSSKRKNKNAAEVL